MPEEYQLIVAGVIGATVSVAAVLLLVVTTELFRGPPGPPGPPGCS